jgi:transcriptional regulator with XRE-family HTH domain
MPPFPRPSRATGTPKFLVDHRSLIAYKHFMNKSAAIKSNQVVSAIGIRLQELRMARGFSLKDLSAKSGFAKSYLSQIENHKREPSISALSQIAHVLEVDLIFLLTGELRESGTNNLTIVRKGERKTTHQPIGDAEYRYEALTYKKSDRLMEGYIVSIGPEFPTEPFIHEGQEMIYVLEGSLELIYDGGTFFVEEGDCLYLDSNRAHLFRSRTKAIAKVFAAFTARKNFKPRIYKKKGGV